MDRRIGPLQRLRMTDTSEQTCFVTMLVPYSGSEPGTLPTVSVNRINPKTGEIAVRIEEGDRVRIVKLQRYNEPLHATARADAANRFTPIDRPKTARPPREPQEAPGSGEPAEATGGGGATPAGSNSALLRLRQFVPSMWVSFRLASHCRFWSDTPVDVAGDSSAGDLA
jgi:hypothetical protein